MDLKISNYLLSINWLENDAIDFMHLTQLILARVPIDVPSFVSMKGKGWPSTATREKFGRLLSAISIESLTDFSLIDDSENPDGLDFYYSWSRNGQLSLSSVDPHERLNAEKLIEEVCSSNADIENGIEIVAPKRCRYGLKTGWHMAMETIAPIPKQARVLSLFKNLQYRVALSRGFKLSRTDIFLVPQKCFAPSSYFDREVYEGCSLRSWIGQGVYRGSLIDVTPKSCQWSVCPDKIELVTHEIWPTNFIVGSEWFTINGWDRDWNVPILQLKPNMDMLE